VEPVASGVDVRINPLTYRDLWKWLNEPDNAPVIELGPEQFYLFA
jgi:hypothetical protein